MLIAVIGSAALWYLFGWMASAIAASYISGRKGYGERAGLASGLILAPIGVIVWLLWPAREGSDWKEIGVFGHEKLDADQPAPAQGPAGGSGPMSSAS
jgi:hypothetical protein